MNQSRASLGETNFEGLKKYPTIDFKGDEDFAIKILDNMIQVEEEMAQGFSMYNRGKNLKKSLINPDRVKEYLKKMEQDKEQPTGGQADQLISLQDQSLTEIMNIDGAADQLQMVPMPSLPQVPAPLAIMAPGDPDLVFLQDNHIDEDKQWRLMLDYFKKNPSALMDAIPTPPGEEEDKEALKDFRTGLTPKRGQSFKFGGSG